MPPHDITEWQCRLDRPERHVKSRCMMHARKDDSTADPGFPTYEEVEARLRAEYARHTPGQREIYGDKPSEGVIAGEWIRAQCNDETDEEHYAAADRAMAIIYGATSQAHAKQPVLS